MSDDDWAKSEDGRIIVFPLAGYETRAVPEGAIAVRVGFLASGQSPERKTGTLQLIMTPDAAREFGGDLIAAAERSRPQAKT